MDKRKSFSVITLGCFRNTYDSGLIAYDISRRGYYFLPDFYSANPKKRRIKNCDTILVNTCHKFKEKDEDKKNNSLWVLS
jgi:tRNA A37 methylthiotransferase MiaB